MRGLYRSATVNFIGPVFPNLKVRPMPWWLAALILLSWSPTALTASSEGAFALKGVGQASCQRFLDEREAQSSAYIRFVGWTHGYLSAYNQLSEATADIIPWQSAGLIDALLARYCKEHPEVQYARAVSALTVAWRPTRLKEASERIEVEAHGESVTLYKAILRRLQQSLADLGHYGGAIDGIYGPVTRKAIEAFQEANDLKMTGLPDQRTLYILFR